MAHYWSGSENMRTLHEGWWQEISNGSKRHWACPNSYTTSGWKPTTQLFSVESPKRCSSTNILRDEWGISMVERSSHGCQIKTDEAVTGYWFQRPQPSGGNWPSEVKWSLLQSSKWQPRGSEEMCTPTNMINKAIVNQEQDSWVVKVLLNLYNQMEIKDEEIGAGGNCPIKS